MYKRKNKKIQLVDLNKSNRSKPKEINHWKKELKKLDILLVIPKKYNK